MLPLIALAETDLLIIDHNPNIVVGRDAEHVLVLDADGAHAASVKTTGSIDEEVVIAPRWANRSEGCRESLRPALHSLLLDS